MKNRATYIFYITLLSLHVSLNAMDFLRGLGKFAQQAWHNGRITEIGTIFPCSYTTGAKMIADLENCSIPNNGQKLYVLEAGGGTGTMTHAFIDKLEELRTNRSIEYQLDVAEINPDLCKVLRETFKNNPRVQIIEGDITQHIPAYKYHFITSSIPFNALPLNVVKAIIDHFAKISTKAAKVTYVEYAGWNAAKTAVLKAIACTARRRQEHQEVVARANYLARTRQDRAGKTITNFANVPPINVHTMRAHAS